MKAVRVRTRADVAALEAFHTDFHLLDGQGGTPFEWSLVQARRTDVPLVVAGGLTPENVARRHRRDATRSRSTSPAASRSGPGSRTPARSRRSRRRPSPPAPRCSREPRRGGRRAPLRRVRRPVRPRDAHARAGRARGGVGRRAAATRATATSSRGCCATTPGARPRSTSPSASARSRAARCGSSARTSCTRGRTSSTTRSGRRCWPSGWASRGSSPRPARGSTASRARPPARCSAWSASSTWARRTSAARSPTCSGWSCWARRWSRSTAGAMTLKEAASEAIRDWVTNVADTHYVLGSAVGPAPYPAIVRDLQRIIGDEARAELLDRTGRLPERVIACVGGGSNAIGMFTALRRRRGRRADRRRGGGRRPGVGPPRRAADGRRPRRASCTARSRPCSRPTTARSSRRTRSRRASTTRAPAPSTPSCATAAARPTWRSATTTRSPRSAASPSSRASSRRSRPPTRSRTR